MDFLLKLCGSKNRKQGCIIVSKDVSSLLTLRDIKSTFDMTRSGVAGLNRVCHAAHFTWTSSELESQQIREKERTGLESGVRLTGSRLNNAKKHTERQEEKGSTTCVNHV